MGGKVCLRCKVKTLLRVVNKLLKTKSDDDDRVLFQKHIEGKFVDNVGNVLPLHLKQTFPPIISIISQDEGDGIESRLFS